MELEKNIAGVLSSFGLGLNNFLIQRIDSGHINHTYKLGSEYILQRINKNVFLQPEILSDNLNIAADFLSENSPQYLLPSPIKNNNNEDLIFDQEGYPWRLFPYIKNTFTINEVANVGQAYAAAKAFGELTKLLSSCHTGLFKESIPDFHNLSARFLQFEHSLSGASSDRLRDSEQALSGYTSYKYLVEEYEELVASNRLILRIMHNDTKINNVLFRQDSNEVVCVIDLDTLMPGYFLYDLGDMIRTFVSPVSEEEGDISKITVRKEINEAVITGYMSEMDQVLTASERQAIPLAGPIMTFMIGLRFLTDYLKGDVYYKTTYPGQNLVRATNQLSLLDRLVKSNR